MRTLPALARLALGVALTAAVPAVADPPPLISYQGVLMQDDGIVVPDGTYDLRFEIFHQESAGTPVFSQILTVQVANGLYNVLLSDNGQWVLADAFDQSPAYMQVTVLANGGSVPQDVVLQPRQQIASVPWALSAGAGAGGGLADWDEGQRSSASGTTIAQSPSTTTLAFSGGTSPSGNPAVTIPEEGSFQIRVHPDLWINRNGGGYTDVLVELMESEDGGAFVVVDEYELRLSINVGMRLTPSFTRSAPTGGSTYEYQLRARRAGSVAAIVDGAGLLASAPPVSRLRVEVVAVP